MYSAPTPISMQLTVQLPPIQLRPPLASAFLITGRFTGSRMMTASSFMRSVEAASIQWPFQPAARSFGKTSAGVVAALRGDDDVAALSAAMSNASCSAVSFFAMRRGLAAGIAGGEEHRLDQREVAFGLHAVHQHRADHAAPADQSYECHFSLAFPLIRTPGFPGSFAGVQRGGETIRDC